MFSPGAATSIDAFALEKYDDPLPWFVAATDRTWGHAAGKLTGLPASNSLPAAATTIVPSPYASAIAVVLRVAGLA